LRYVGISMHIAGIWAVYANWYTGNAVGGQWNGTCVHFCH